MFYLWHLCLRCLWENTHSFCREYWLCLWNLKFPDSVLKTGKPDPERRDNFLSMRFLPCHRHGPSLSSLSQNEKSLVIFSFSLLILGLAQVTLSTWQAHFQVLIGVLLVDRYFQNTAAVFNAPRKQDEPRESRDSFITHTLPLISSEEKSCRGNRNLQGRASCQAGSNFHSLWLVTRVTYGAHTDELPVSQQEKILPCATHWAEGVSQHSRSVRLDWDWRCTVVCAGMMNRCSHVSGSEKRVICNPWWQTCSSDVTKKRFGVMQQTFRSVVVTNRTWWVWGPN